MTIDKILTELDSEIAKLQKVRALLSSDGAKKTPSAPIRKHSTMSAAARKRIGDAQRKRWAKQKATS